jgi:hypothetical protein
MNNSATKLTALTIASLSSFITPFMISSINIALPVIGKEFRTDLSFGGGRIPGTGW